MKPRWRRLVEAWPTPPIDAPPPSPPLPTLNRWSLTTAILHLIDQFDEILKCVSAVSGGPVSQFFDRRMVDHVLATGFYSVEEVNAWRRALSVRRAIVNGPEPSIETIKEAEADLQQLVADGVARLRRMREIHLVPRAQVIPLRRTRQDG